jgi:hypothetical protein
LKNYLPLRIFKCLFLVIFKLEKVQNGRLHI